MVHHGPWQEGSTAADRNHQNISGTIYRASVTSVKWDVCTEAKDTKRQHPPRYTLFTLLPSDNRYTSTCCHNTRLQSSFIPQAVRLLLLFYWQHYLVQLLIASISNIYYWCIFLVIIITHNCNNCHPHYIMKYTQHDHKYVGTQASHSIREFICCYNSLHSSRFRLFTRFWNVAAGICSHSATRALVRLGTGVGW